MSICPVCITKYTREKRRDINCPKCAYTACLECYRNYFKESAEHMCMNPDCGEEMSETTIYNNFPKIAQRMYREQQGDREFQKELAMMPLTIMEMNRRTKDDDLLKKRRATEIKIASLKEKLLEIDTQRSRLRNSKNGSMAVGAFTYKCPVDCRGFLNEKYGCDVCHRNFCSACLEEKKGDHECDPRAVETVSLIKRDSKPCPNCSELIYKSEGCDQMYCTACSTGFEWKTGRIVTRNIHNPHWLDEQRRRTGNIPRAVGDVPCGGMPHPYQIKEKVVNDGYASMVIYYDGIIQFVTALRDEKIPIYVPSDPFKCNLESRIKYLKNDITEAEFKTAIKKSNTRQNKKRMVYEATTTLAVSLEDQLRNAIVSNDHKNIIVMCKELVEYFNSYFKETEEVFGMRMPRIHSKSRETWSIETKAYTTYTDAYYMLSNCM